MVRRPELLNFVRRRTEGYRTETELLGVGIAPCLMIGGNTASGKRTSLDNDISQLRG